MTPRRWLAGALLLGLVVGAAALWWQRTALVEALALRALAARGAPASLRVTRLDLGVLELADLRVGDAAAPDLSIARAALAWSWCGLFERRLDRLELSGVRLRGRLADDGLELGALDTLRGDGGGASAAPALPFAEAQLEDVELAIESAHGPLVLRAEGRVATLDPRSHEVEGTAEVNAATPFGSGTASLRLGGTLDAPRVAAKLAVERADLPALAQLTGVEVDAQLAGDALEATVRVAKLVELSRPALVAPLGVEAKLTGDREQLAFRGEAKTDGDGFTLRFDGTLDPRAPGMKLTVRVAETDLAPAPRQPVRLFPWLEGLVLRAKGRAAGEVEAVFTDGKLSARAVVALRDVDLRTPYATLRRVNGVVTLLGPKPLATPPGQTVSVALIEGALPLSAGVLNFELLPSGALRVEQGTFRLAGGTLALAASLPLEAEERTLLLTAKRLSVEQILAALDFEGLSGTGFLSGTLPLEQRGPHVRVAGGELRATEPGVIRYSAGAGGAALAEGQPQLGPVLGALEDLRYESLTLEVSGDAAEQLEVKVHVRGHNPNFQEGRPVVLNVNVEAPVHSLLRAGLVAYRVPEQIEGQVNRYFDRGKK